MIIIIFCFPSVYNLNLNIRVKNRNQQQKNNIQLAQYFHQQKKFILIIIFFKIQIQFFDRQIYKVMQRRKVCRYFQRGSCRKQNCPFVHIKQNRKICVYYKEGNCRKGNNCNFYHPPKQQEKLNNLKQQLKKHNKEKNKKKHETSSEQQPQQYENKVIQQNEIEQQKKIVEHQEIKKQKIQQKQQQREINEEQQNDVQEQMQKLNMNEKMQKIDFLLGLNKQDDQHSSQSAQNQQQKQNKIQDLQFLLTYPKKFPDFSKTLPVKQLVKQKQAILFEGKTYLNLISTLQDQKQKQYFQIIRKFTDSFELIQNEKYHYIIKMRPLLYQKQINLHFDFKEDTLNLIIDAREYPKQRAIFNITNDSIPKDYKQKFISCINKYHQNRSLFVTLKYILNNFEKIYEQSKFKLQNQHYSKKEIQRKQKQEKKMKKEEIKSQDNIQTELTKKKPKQSNEDRHRDVIVTKYKQGQKMQNINFDYEISVESMLLNNCEYVLVEKALAYIECVCQKKFMYILDLTKDRSLKAGVKLMCKKCQIVMVLGLQRQVVQVKKQILGRFGISNGHVIDIGGVSFKIGCSCTEQISKNKLYLPGQRIPSNCHTCFKVMNLSYNGLKLYNPTLKIPQIVSDKQLPNKGCCKHIKLSFRWYRYGCCGRCFSCDDCHLIQSVTVHQKIKGITMLCGFCSREQAISNQCIYCNKQLVKGVQKSGHWQGGYGCRDQTLLSRKDNKKYAGLTKKTKNEQK